MFTNVPVPFPFAKSIISDNYNVIAMETTVPVELFLEAVSFLVDISCYFTFGGEVFRQTKGLTMGNRISQILADISTNYATKLALDSMEKEDISFVKKSVDDFAGAMKEDVIERFEEVLTSNIKGLKIKRGNESAERSISFLDTLIISNQDSTMETRWWQKECSSRQILNFHYYLSTQTKRNVVSGHIRHRHV